MWLTLSGSSSSLLKYFCSLLTLTMACTIFAIPVGRNCNGRVSELTNVNDTNAIWALSPAFPDIWVYIVKDTTVYWKMRGEVFYFLMTDYKYKAQHIPHFYPIFIPPAGKFSILTGSENFFKLSFLSCHTYQDRWTCKGYRSAGQVECCSFDKA